MNEQTTLVIDPDPNNRNPSIPPGRIESETSWRLCSGHRSDARFVNFMAILFISVMMLGFACYQISRNDLSCGQESLWVGMITLIVGFWIKSPHE